jgi:hypothetical protein
MRGFLQAAAVPGLPTCYGKKTWKQAPSEIFGLSTTNESMQ